MTVASVANDGPAVRRAFQEAGLDVRRMEPVAASMEDAFIEYVEGAKGS